MNGFDHQIAETTGDVLRACGIDTIQVNVGLRCNMACAHCHLACSPDRPEMMAPSTLEQVMHVVSRLDCRLVDITGGAPELFEHLRPFVVALRSGGHAVQVRTNLTILAEPAFLHMPRFYASHGVRLVASLPCYLAENVDAQRGPGAFTRSIEVLRTLNAAGYGKEPGLALDLVHNPGGPFLPPPQAELEADYRRELSDRFGVVFTRLLTITNMPVGRFDRQLAHDQARREYLTLLRDAFNPSTVNSLMCRRQISVGWDGTLYDCDFNLARGMPIDHGAPHHIRDFVREPIARRQIVTGDHCFGCTAGAGSSCGGALADPS